LHKSVLLKEVLEWLAPAPGMIVVDGTLGAGGHAEAVLERILPGGLLIGFDKDPEALARAKEVLSRFGDRTMILHEDFRNVAKRLKTLQKEKAQGVLLDLGVSSMQLDTPERGFSFKQNGPLDMRMNPEESLTAREIVNRFSEKDLLKILWNYGEERFARRIVERIARERSQRPIETTGELEAIVFQAAPKAYRYGRIHPATRTFQALRIAVNREREALEEFLSSVLEILDTKGRLVIISFHSLEDRAVKTAFRKFEKEKRGRVLTKKPVVPNDAEVADNPRARSAKLRAFEKISGEEP